MSCCPPDRTPALTSPSSYVRQGHVIILGGHPSYITHPPSIPYPADLSLPSSSSATAMAPASGVIMLADVFGYDSGRHCGIADLLAKKNHVVLIPDLFEGARLEMSDLFPSFSEKAGQVIGRGPDKFIPMMNSCYQYMQRIGVKRIALVGFCWGVWAAFHETQPSRLHPLTTRIVGYHPSLVIESMHKNDMMALVNGCQVPSLLFPCGNDPIDIKPNGQVELALKSKFGDKFQNHLFEDMSHGFVSQGDISDDKVRENVDTAMKMTLDYLQ